MFKYILLIAICIPFPFLLIFIIPYFIFRLFTIKERRKKYFSEAITWRFGGAFGTGEIDINKAINLYKKSSNLGNAEASFHLGEMYADGESHNGYELLRPNKNLSHIYFERCKLQSPEIFFILHKERTDRKNQIEKEINSIFSEMKY